MNEFDIAYLYNNIQLQRAIESSISERNFWFGLMSARFNEVLREPYYRCQYEKYRDHVEELMALQKEKFGE